MQGVSFRASAREEAQRLGLSGWVRNLPDGSVESLAEGPEARLSAFVGWCHCGPDEAAVEEVKQSWSDGTGEFQGFEVTR